jgi:putative aldouronate transport system permease protein
VSKLKVKNAFDWPHTIFVIILCLWGLIILYPFYNSVLMSIVPMGTYLRTPFLFYPKKIDLDSFKFVFGWHAIWGGALVTVFITIVGTAYNVFLTVMTAYALSKKIPGRKFFNYMIIFTMFFQGGLIPYYLLISHTLNLRNNIFSMILPTGIQILYMMVMRSYFQTIPAEIEESAKIDGANDAVILFKIVLPLCLPMLATISLFYAVDRWNEWWFGQLFITQISKMPLQLFIKNMLATSSVITNGIPVNLHISVFPEGIKMACIIVTAAPIICVYPFLQKYFVKGLVLGGVKS